MAEDKKWAVIANPTSGRGKGRKLGAQIYQLLLQSGTQVTLDWTAARGDAEWLTARALERGATGIIVCGGDGTTHESINGLLHSPHYSSSLPLGVAPAGQCNDLATNLGLCRRPRDIVASLQEDKTRLIDLGKAGDRYFSTVAALGFDSSVALYVAEGHTPKFLTGTASYLYGLFVQLLTYKDVPMRLDIDGLEIEDRVFLAATANTSTYGGQMKVAPSAVIDDSFLDLCLVPSVGRKEVLKMLPKIFSGGHVRHPAVSLYRVQRLTVETDPRMWVMADGERAAQTPVTIEVVPKALCLVSST